MPATRAVLFDFGGTLVPNQPVERGLLLLASQVVPRYGMSAAPASVAQAFAKAFAHLLPTYLQRDFYLTAELYTAVFHQALTGLGVPLSEPAAHALSREWLQFVSAELALHDGVVETLVALRERGISTGIVSLADEGELTDVVAAVGLSELVDFALSTEAAQSCKPHPGIFAEALRRAGCAAAETLFVGDSPPMDIAGANRAGMTTVLLLSSTTLAGRSSTSALEGELKPDYVIQSIPEVLRLLA